jgi:hypothetical protein
MDVETYKSQMGQEPLKFERKRPFFTEQIQVLVGALKKEIGFKIAMADAEYLMGQEMKGLKADLLAGRDKIAANGYCTVNNQERGRLKASFMTDQETWHMTIEDDVFSLRREDYVDPMAGELMAQPSADRLHLKSDGSAVTERWIDQNPRGAYDERSSLQLMLKQREIARQARELIEVMKEEPSIKLKAMREVKGLLADGRTEEEFSIPGVGRVKLSVSEEAKSSAWPIKEQRSEQMIGYQFEPETDGQQADRNLRKHAVKFSLIHVDKTPGVHDHNEEGMRAASLKMEAEEKDPNGWVDKGTNFGWEKGQWELVLMIAKMWKTPEAEKQDAVINLNKNIRSEFSREPARF